MVVVVKSWAVSNVSIEVEDSLVWISIQSFNCFSIKASVSASVLSSTDSERKSHTFDIDGVYIQGRREIGRYL